MRQARAVEIGDLAVAWLLDRPERLAELLASSGVSPDALRALVASPDFPGFALDFVLASDAAVLDFTAHAGIRPEDPALARAVLAGPAAAEWT